MSDIIDEIREILSETCGFYTSGRRAQDNINAAFELLDSLRDRLVAAERRARAFDAIASGDVELYEIHRPAYWTVETTSDPLRAVSDPDLLTAIEAATREAKP